LTSTRDLFKSSPSPLCPRDLHRAPPASCEKEILVQDILAPLFRGGSGERALPALFTVLSLFAARSKRGILTTCHSPPVGPDPPPKCSSPPVLTDGKDWLPPPGGHTRSPLPSPLFHPYSHVTSQGAPPRAEAVKGPDHARSIDFFFPTRPPLLNYLI